MKYLKTILQIMMLASLATLVFPQEMPSSYQRTEKSKPTLVSLAGIVQKEKQEARKIKSGWAVFLKPAESVLISVIQDEMSPLESRFSQRLDPGAKVFVSRQTHTIRWEISGGNVEEFLSGGIRFRCPKEPGTYKVSAILQDQLDHSMQKPDEKTLAEHNVLGSFVFHFLVMYPFDRDGSGIIEGYPIGIYPNEDGDDVKSSISSHKEAYKPPEYFIKITPENATVQIFEHFRLGDFSPPNEKGKNHFIALDPRLVTRLENIISGLKEKNLNVTGLKILRAYLSPYEVERLSRKDIKIAKFSRTIYGDSVIFIVDENNDGIMDDLNNDGKLDNKDLNLIEEIVQNLESQSRLYGGIGLYYYFKDLIHKDTPCIQIDTRGHHSRWGNVLELQTLE